MQCSFSTVRFHVPLLHWAVGCISVLGNLHLHRSPVASSSGGRNGRCSYSSWRDGMWANIASLTSEKVPFTMLLKGGGGGGGVEAEHEEERRCWRKVMNWGAAGSEDCIASQIVANGAKPGITGIKLHIWISHIRACMIESNTNTRSHGGEATHRELISLGEILGT